MPTLLLYAAAALAEIAVVLAELVHAAGSVTVGPNTGGTPFNTLQPSMALNFIITMMGLYPMRPN